MLGRNNNYLFKQDEFSFCNEKQGKKTFSWYSEKWIAMRKVLNVFICFEMFYGYISIAIRCSNNNMSYTHLNGLLSIDHGASYKTHKKPFHSSLLQPWNSYGVQSWMQGGFLLSPQSVLTLLWCAVVNNAYQQQK